MPNQDNRPSPPPFPPSIPKISPVSSPSGVVARSTPVPAVQEVAGLTPQQVSELRERAQGLDAIDYFELMRLGHTATPADIKQAFYTESRAYHPDRFFHLPDTQLKADIASVYKRITEAYYVLRDDLKRKKYLADVTGPDRANRLRYTEATEAELKTESRKVVEEEFGTNPKARPFFKTASADFEKQNWAAAERNLKMGLTYEPGNVRFKEKLVEVQKKIEEQRRSQGPSFQIK